MLSCRVIEGNQILLRNVEESDCTVAYLEWLNNPDVNRYLETRLYPQSMETIRRYVDNMRQSTDSILFAMIDKGTKTHIGNIKIGPVHPFYKYADVSYFIGNKSYWGKGIATEAVKMVCSFGISDLKLHRIQAGVIEGNCSSQRVLEKAGFVLEARLKDKFIIDEEYRDHLIYRLIPE